MQLSFYYRFIVLVKNSVDPDQLASIYLKESIEFGKSYACIELIRLKIVGTRLFKRIKDAKF